MESDDAGRAHHESHRIGVAQILGRLTTVHFGLWGVPAHVRRLTRVRRGVNAKIGLYHAYLVLDQQRRHAAPAASMRYVAGGRGERSGAEGDCCVTVAGRGMRAHRAGGGVRGTRRGRVAYNVGRWMNGRRTIR